MSLNRSREKKTISFQTAKIVATQELSSRVKRITLAPAEPFTWIPGQFIITKWNIDETEIVADYTIFSTNNVTSQFDILVDNHQTSVVGKILHKMKTGDTFTFKGPRGRFYLEEKDDPNGLIFIFRDIGIAAAVPLLRQLAERGSIVPIHLFNVVTSDFEEILKEEIENITGEMTITYTKLTPESSGIEDQRLSRGKLSKKEVLDLFAEFQNCTYYLSGISEFNKNLRQKLISIGVSKDKFFREMFG